mgnify:CR=1 FL=1
MNTALVELGCRIQSRSTYVSLIPRVGFVDFEPLHQSQEWLTVPFWKRLSVDHMTDAFWINRIQFSSQTGGGTLTLRGGTPDSGYVNPDTELSDSRHRFCTHTEWYIKSILIGCTKCTVPPGVPYVIRN